MDKNINRHWMNIPKERKIYRIKRTGIKMKVKDKVKKKINRINDKKLWKVFSEYIRRRDSDENGMCSCFTCGLVRHWKKMDCGHGIGRQHRSTKYSEKNNHAQCKKCNGLEGGMRERYKEEMNKRYGPQTWELMELAAKKRAMWTQFEIDQMTIYYKQQIEKL